MNLNFSVRKQLKAFCPTHKQGTCKRPDSILLHCQYVLRISLLYLILKGLDLNRDWISSVGYFTISTSNPIRFVKSPQKKSPTIDTLSTWTAK